MKIEVDRLDLDELKELGVESWPVWEHDEDKFEWFYDKTERCYIVALGVNHIFRKTQVRQFFLMWLISPAIAFLLSLLLIILAGKYGFL